MSSTPDPVEIETASGRDPRLAKEGAQVRSSVAAHIDSMLGPALESDPVRGELLAGRSPPGRAIRRMALRVNGKAHPSRGGASARDSTSSSKHGSGRFVLRAPMVRLSRERPFGGARKRGVG